MLLRANFAVLMMSVIHGLDHAFNQDRALSATAGIPADVGIAVLLVAIGLTLLKSPYAGFVTAVGGFGHALGLVLIHVLPDWGSVSDSYFEVNVNALSWAVVVIAIGVSVWAGVVGMRDWSGRQLRRAELQ